MAQTMDFGTKGTDWTLNKYPEIPGANAASRGVTSMLAYLPHSVFQPVFRMTLALPPAISGFSVYWLTQPEYENIDCWRHVQTKHFDAGLMRLRDQYADIGAANITILYAHGGAGIVGHARMYSVFFRELLEAIESASGHAKSVQVLSVEYHLADSNHSPPMQQNEITAAYQFLLSQGVRPESIIIAGDSAGAMFATRAMLDHPLQYKSDMKLAGALLISPWAELRSDYSTDKSWTASQDSTDIISSSFLAYGLQGMNAGQQTTSLQQLSPASASDDTLARLPPALVTIGGAERLRDSIVRFCDRLPGCERLELAGGIHDWATLPQIVPARLYAQRAQHIQRMGEWIVQRVT